MLKFSRFTLSSVLASGLILSMTAGAFAADPIDERVKAFKGAKQSVAQIKDGLSSGDNAAIAEAAKSLSALGGRIPGMFPEGSDQGKTDARAEIWSTVPDFTSKAKALQGRSDALVQLASTGAGKAELSDAFGKVIDSCKACHRSYKED